MGFRICKNEDLERVTELLVESEIDVVWSDKDGCFYANNSDNVDELLQANEVEYEWL